MMDEMNAVLFLFCLLVVMLGFVLLFTIGVAFLIGYFEVKMFNQMFGTKFTPWQFLWLGDSIKERIIGKKVFIERDFDAKKKVLKGGGSDVAGKTP